MRNFTDYLLEQDNIQTVARKDYGQELILDIHDVPSDFFHRTKIGLFAKELCTEIKMKHGPRYLWGTDREEHKHKTGEDAIKADGISCVQFLYNSSITIHALDEIQKVFINIFSCDRFDAEKAKVFTEKNVGGKIVSAHNILRK